MRKCIDNLRHGLNSIIVTIADSVPVAHALLKNSDIARRVEVWDLEQLLSTNVFEHGRFDSNERKNVLDELIKNYNGIIDRFETDPSLKIEHDLLALGADSAVKRPRRFAYLCGALRSPVFCPSSAGKPRARCPLEPLAALQRRYRNVGPANGHGWR